MQEAAVRLALPNLGPPDEVDAALEVLFACLKEWVGAAVDPPQAAAAASSASASSSGGSSSSSPALEVWVVEEAAGNYAAKLQAVAQAAGIPLLPTPPSPPSSSSSRAAYLHLGDITRLADDGHLPPATPPPEVLAAPCDHRLLPSDAPVSGAVFKAAGPALASTAKLLFHRAGPGRAYPVRLTPASGLRAQQGVQFVVLSAPPTDASDPGWQEALRETYRAVFTTFAQEVAPKVVAAAAAAAAAAVASSSSKPVPPPPAKKARTGATTATAAAAVEAPQTADDGDEEEEKEEETAHLPIPDYRHPGPPPMAMGWQGGLHQYLARRPHGDGDEATAGKYVFMETKGCVVVYDGFPKARVHLLLMPRPERLAAGGVGDLRREHLDGLTRLHAEARRIQAKLSADLESQGRRPPRIRLGYHSLPSLRPLHLHIVSQDFYAPALKTKKHWNSFTTEFFLDADQVEASLREHGRVPVDKARAEALLKRPLRCHACGGGQANMPTLKAHLAHCRRVRELT